MKHSGAGDNQLRWVILLLCAVVVLPTVCLLWFMNQAMRNERLAVRQRLVDFYTERAEKLFSEYAAKGWRPEKAVGGADSRYQGLVVYDANGVIEYPVLGVAEGVESGAGMERAWGLEFVEKNYEKAARVYGEIADSNETSAWGAAMEGKARSLKKAGRLSEAAAVYVGLGWPSGEKTVAVTGRARVMVMRLYQSLAHPEFYRVCQRVLDSRFADLDIGSEARVFLLGESIDIVKKAGLSGRLAKQIEEARKTMAREELSLLAAERYPNSAAFKGWEQGTFRNLGGEAPLYGIYYIVGARRVMGIIDAASMKAFWGAPVEDIEDETVFCRVLDDAGRIAAGTDKVFMGREIVMGARFLSQEIGGNFAGWKGELYFFGGTFDAAAERQQLVYLWTAGLVIGLMVLVAGLAGKAILHEAKLNRLKNDFIATVSHELKTPLASTRVLVDTLLKENYKDEGTVKEYLQLVSRENERLTRLIENFLTFSRMERNKQAFDMAEAEAGDIARVSAEAVRTKFDEKKCEFSVTVEEPLASIFVDKDAMVTVLVNLLDNAYKYTGEKKRIALRVYSEDGQVCFEVKDNGTGMTKRQVKRIFDRFYQADSSLARRAEGCGLGLSIVKFIVDAHKGTIGIESRVGEGSEFVVKLPPINSGG